MQGPANINLNFYTITFFSAFYVVLKQQVERRKMRKWDIWLNLLRHRTQNMAPS